ncbi:MAG TPA: hypothetical protein VKQ36_05235 [Ktedonobacterales bacterium]|nr:hypothetical protein [Ktedonobacterales bacterium]
MSNQEQQRQASTWILKTLATQVMTYWLAALLVWREALGQRLSALVRRSLPRLARVIVLALLLVATLLGTFAQGNGLAFAAPAPRRPQGNEQPNLFDPTTVADHGKVAKTLPGQGKPAPRHSIQAPILRPTGITMRPLLIPLTAGITTIAHSSDKRLEVTVPASAVTTQLVAHAQSQARSEHAAGLHTVVTPNGAALGLQVTQVEGPSGGSDGGEVTFGTYLFTLVDLYGQRVHAQLAQPAQLALTLPPSWVGAGFSLTSVRLIVNGSLPVSTLQTLHWPKDAHGRYLPLGPRSSMAATVTLPSLPTTKKPAGASAGQGSLANQGIILHAIILAGSGGGGSSSGTWNTNAPNAYWQKPSDTSVDLSTGDLTYSYPLYSLWPWRLLCASDVVLQ